MVRLEQHPTQALGATIHGVRGPVELIGTVLLVDVPDPVVLEEGAGLLIGRRLAHGVEQIAVQVRVGHPGHVQPHGVATPARGSRTTGRPSAYAWAARGEWLARTRPL